MPMLAIVYPTPGQEYLERQPLRLNSIGLGDDMTAIPIAILLSNPIRLVKLECDRLRYITLLQINL